MNIYLYEFTYVYIINLNNIVRGANLILVKKNFIYNKILTKNKFIKALHRMVYYFIKVLNTFLFVSKNLQVILNKYV
jgi:hypothetical protein